MPPRASTAVKVAALALAAPALLLPMKAAAQQMALGGPSAAGATAIDDCQKLSTGAERDRCSMKIVIEENKRLAAAASQRADASDRNIACTDEIKSGIAKGTYTPQRLKDVLAGRPAKEVGPCNILAQLKS